MNTHEQENRKLAKKMANDVFLNAFEFLFDTRPQFTAHFGFRQDVHTQASQRLLRLLGSVGYPINAELSTTQHDLGYGAPESNYEIVHNVVASVGSKAVIASSTVVGLKRLVTDVVYSSAVFPLTEEQASQLAG